MNRNLFATLVLLFCIILVIGISSCESKSGPKGATMPVTIILDKQVATMVMFRKYRVHKINDRTVYFWTTDQPYQVGDTVSTTLTRLIQ